MTNDPSRIKAPSNSSGATERKTPKKKDVSRFRDAARLQQSFSAEAEQKTLAWLAARLPARVNSDHLTFIGCVAMLLAGGSYAFARTNRAGLVLATFFLALNWFGDSLDGTLARLRNRQRPATASMLIT